MGKRQVVIVGDGTLLSSGVESLLRQVPDLELLSVRGEGEECYELIRSASPDVIVVEGSTAQQAQRVSVDRLLRDNPQARVIAVGLDRADFDVYRSERVEHASGADLLATIEGSLSPAPGTGADGPVGRGDE